MFDGREVRGLDQTGLSQKAGPVISDVVLARSGRHSSNLVGDGQAHLLLGFDGLVAASDTAIRAASPDRTVTIASTHRTPTGRMITHPALPYPDEPIERRLDARSRPEANRFPDATALAIALTGSSASANVFLVGVAIQDGRVPISIPSIERAIELNGVAVDANLAALEMPPTIHALLAARIERLRPEERTLLERAAVVGRNFSRNAVAALLRLATGDRGLDQPIAEVVIRDAPSTGAQAGQGFHLEVQPDLGGGVHKIGVGKETVLPSVFAPILVLFEPQHTQLFRRRGFRLVVALHADNAPVNPARVRTAAADFVATVVKPQAGEVVGVLPAA